MTKTLQIDTSEPTDATEKGKQQAIDVDAEKGTVEKEKPPSNIDVVIVETNKSWMSKRIFHQRKKRYIGYTRLDQFE